MLRGRSHGKVCYDFNVVSLSGYTMFRMIFQTLVVVLLTMLIAGRDDPAAPGGDIGIQATAEAAPSTARNGIVRAVAIADRESDPVPAALITPVTSSPMPGPALRPSPEYRTRNEPVVDPQLWQVSASRLNVRAGPSTSNPVMTTLSRGEEVLVVSDPGSNWVHIRIEGDGVDGWVARKLLSPLR